MVDQTNGAPYTKSEVDTGGLFESCAVLGK